MIGACSSWFWNSSVLKRLPPSLGRSWTAMPLTLSPATPTVAREILLSVFASSVGGQLQSSSW